MTIDGSIGCKMIRRIAYVRLTSFGERTVHELESVLIDLDNDFDAMVLDLRGNGGGLLHAAVDVSNMFLNSGKIVSTRTRGGQIEDRFSADPGTLVTRDKPIAVLMDGNSASASEIVAACLQDNGRAVVVGHAKLRQRDGAKHPAAAVRPQRPAFDRRPLLPSQRQEYPSTQRCERRRMNGV